MGDNLKLFLEIMTPCCLAALFVINLMQSREQLKNKNELEKYQSTVKEDLHRFNGQIRDGLDKLKDTITDLRIEVKEHVAHDDEFQKGIGRTLQRMDGKLDNNKC
jgi:hypothetical protein